MQRYQNTHISTENTENEISVEEAAETVATENE